ncbi:MAG: hypothetical protein ALECFALPRED_006079 [Alectoria fallacina]|uniref:Uncharacterized protein n=1 Tax=Alectoria fallacina TaxID=1903189 RepID=A0A8H3INS4_9LECA|nr:MAG: hypothetical protein ALECFALPRED_006079 [Alectoria fallacina]
MSFGFSLSDIVVSYQLAGEIYRRCFTQAQRADVKYLQFGRDIRFLGQNLERLHQVVENANDQRPQKPWHDDDNERVTAEVLNTLLEVTGDFKQTLLDCEKLLSDNSKFQRSAANFVDNVAWHSSTERDVASLRERVHFHVIKVIFIAKPFEIQLLLGIRHELKQLRKEVAALRTILDWDPARTRDPINFTTPETYFHIPEDLSDRFRNSLAAKDPELSRMRDGLPLKEGFNALVYNFDRSTVDFEPSRGRGQEVPEEQYLNLVKSRWIIERLRESTYFSSLGPESLWVDYLRELEDEVRGQLVRFQQGGLPPPPLETLSRLPDSCFSIWVHEESSPRPAALTEHRPSEEKILELALQSRYSTHPSTLTIFRKSDIALRLVSATKDDQNERFHSEESKDVNMLQTGLVPVFAASQDTSTVNNNVLLCRQGQDTESYNLRNPADVAQFQRAMTGFRVSHDMSNVSWHIEFPAWSKPSSLSGKARLQLWHLKPLQKIQQPQDTEPGEGSSSSNDPTPYSPVGSIDLRRFWTSGTTQLPGSSIASPVTGSRGDGIALTHPELPVLIIFTKCHGKYTFLHLQLETSIFLKPQSCKLNIRKFCAEQENEQGLRSWNLGCFRYPEHPDFKKLELLRIKYLSLHFDTPDKRDEFCKEFSKLETLRNVDLNGYERTLKETKFLSNNPRSH